VKEELDYLRKHPPAFPVVFGTDGDREVFSGLSGRDVIALVILHSLIGRGTRSGAAVDEAFDVADKFIAAGAR